MDLGLTGRVAIIAGASKGLGFGTASALGAEGASLVIAARGAEDLGKAHAALEAAGASVESLALDVTREGAAEQLVERAIDRFGRLDIVVSNSGGPPPARALEVDDGQIRQAVEANLLTHVRLVRAALPHLRARGFGRIVAIASYGVVQPIPTLALSNLARTGLRAWAKTAAADLAPSGITLNLIAPGLHRTERMTALGAPDGPMGDPADFGAVVAFLCSEQAGFLNGATVVVDGGATVAL